jgi:hypothetical protein
MKYRVRMSQTGHGVLYAEVVVAADSAAAAVDAVCDSDIDWTIGKFSGEGYDLDDVTEVP